MKKESINYLKGELKLMPKKAVADIYYKLLKQSGKEILREDLNKYSKDELIYKYGKLRNKNLIWG